MSMFIVQAGDQFAQDMDRILHNAPEFAGMDILPGAKNLQDELHPRE